MKRKAKSKKPAARVGNVLLVLVAALFVVLLLLRMLVFVAGHGRHHY
jgi:hypothetical protein